MVLHKHISCIVDKTTDTGTEHSTYNYSTNSRMIIMIIIITIVIVITLFISSCYKPLKLADLERSVPVLLE